MLRAFRLTNKMYVIGFSVGREIGRYMCILSESINY